MPAPPSRLACNLVVFCVVLLISRLLSLQGGVSPWTEPLVEPSLQRAACTQSMSSRARGSAPHGPDHKQDHSASRMSSPTSKPPEGIPCHSKKIPNPRLQVEAAPWATESGHFEDASQGPLWHLRVCRSWHEGFGAAFAGSPVTT